MSANATTFRNLSDHPKWKGGTCLNEKNYLRISAGPLRGKYVHILVAEAKLGRELLPGEEVHHKDFDPTNPHWDNLEVLTEDDHKALHNGMRGGVHGARCHHAHEVYA